MKNNIEPELIKTLQDSSYAGVEETECKSACLCNDEDMEDMAVEEFEENEYNINLAGMTFYYLRYGFKKWLIEERKLKIRSAKDYLRRLTKLHNSLAPLVGYDLFEMLGVFLNLESIHNESPDLDFDEDSFEDPQWSRLDESKRELDAKYSEIMTRLSHRAPMVVDDYIDTFNELNEDSEDFTVNLRVLHAFHDFVVVLSGSSCTKYLKEKSVVIPDEEAFQNWLVAEYKMDYENARKILSSVKRMDTILPSVVSDPMSLLDVLYALPTERKRKNYVRLIRKRIQKISYGTDCSDKTISNGLSNITYYLNFLNSQKLNP
ncbi:MAG: hypothetical protein HDR79_00295 [Bacteroides sp.]|nr:hypothetical protein [Bacteroides sp.]MBD5363377.1 hypothetical protein [Bacteroides sp.]